MKRDLLFLAHRIPYPPNKGDKIRSWHLLRHLAENWRVHLGAFVDDPEDWRHVEVLGNHCADLKLLALDPRTGKLRSLRGLISGEALTLPYYRNRALADWVRTKLEAGVDTVVVYSSAMAQYVMDAPGCSRIMDFVDIDSDKWRQYAPTKAWPLSWLYEREGRRLLDWEKRVAAEFNAGLFVSAAEAEDFRSLAPESKEKIGYYNNGVDAGFFSPDADYANPFPGSIRPIVFTGAMDYWPNIDAVAWFSREVLPAIRRSHPDAVFYIVGSKPGQEVRALESESVKVTGRVEDVRPYLAHAAVVVTPLRIARGIQNKVLEAMAMAQTVVSSSQALEGIDAEHGKEVLRADSPEEFAGAISAVLEGVRCGEAARRRVLADYAWETNLAIVDTWLRGEVGR